MDPASFSKRSKGAENLLPANGFFKQPSFVLTKADPSPTLAKDAFSPKFISSSSSTPRARPRLQPKSPSAKMNARAKPSPLSAPAGRSPTRGSKRIGILSGRRRASGPFSRVDPPSFGLASAAPFSLDAALKGTIPTYAGRSSSSASTAGLASLYEPETKSSWFFDIHEDSPEQEMTNLLQHGTCTLDISSDEETEVKARREKAEGRDKENIPPADDVSQTSLSQRLTALPVEGDNMAIEKARGPLVEMDPADYYPEGCDKSSIVFVAGDDEIGPEIKKHHIAPPTPEQPSEQSETSGNSGCAAAIESNPNSDVAVGVLMGKDDSATKAAVLQPMDGTGESFDLWESGSAKDEAEPEARHTTNNIDPSDKQ